MRAPHRRAHRRIWSVLALLIPAIFLTAFALRQDPADAPAPERLEPPAPRAAGGQAQ